MDVAATVIYIHEPIQSPGTNSSAQAARVFRAGRLFSHLTADTEEELVAYAKKIGMRESWIQDKGTYRVHFDVTGLRMHRVLQDPEVRVLTMREFGELLKTKKDNYDRTIPRPEQNPRDE